jgi:hypothetical protein
LAKFRKMGTSRPMNGPEGRGQRPPAHPTGGRSENYFQTPPEGLFTNKTFFIREEALETSHPPNGREVPTSLIFYYFLLEFMFYKLFKIYTFFKYKIYSPYSFVYINFNFLLEFIFYKLFKIHTFFKYKIYSPYSFVYINFKFSSILRRRLRYLKPV